jgi:hypothetical protein
VAPVARKSGPARAPMATRALGAPEDTGPLA